MLLSSLNALPRRSTPAITSLATQRCRRWYSIHADHAETKALDIDPTKLNITKTTTPKDILPKEDLVFGHAFTGMEKLRSITRNTADQSF